MIYDNPTDRTLGLTPTTSYNEMSSGYNTISSPRAMLLHQLPPSSGVPSVIHATNKPRRQHLQCKPMPSSRHRGPDFLGSTCGRRASPKRLDFRSQRSGEQRQHQSARKGGCPATCDFVHMAITDTPAACHLRYTIRIIYNPMHDSSLDNGAECAEEIISLTPCDEGQTARFA